MRQASWSGTFGGFGRCRRAQALVNSLLGDRAPRVYYHGSDFTHFATWMDRLLVSLVAQWASSNPGCVPGDAEVTAWHQALVSRGAANNAIVLGVIPVEASWQFEAAFDGAAIHEALHGLYSCQRVPSRAEIRDLIIKNWALIPDWKSFLHFLLNAQNAYEDVRCERRGLLEYPGSLGALEALTDFCIQSPARSAQDLDLPALGLRRFLMAMVHLGHVISTPRVVEYLDALRAGDPDMMREVEEGRYRPILDALRGIDLGDDLGAMRLAIRTAALLAEEGFGSQMSCPSDGCPACGAPRDKLRGLLLPRSNRGSPVRTLVIICGVCGHAERAEVDPGSKGAGQGGEKPLRVLDLEAVGDADGSDPASLPQQVPGAGADTYPSAEKSMESAAEKAWQKQVAAARRGGAGVPYHPHNPGADEVCVLQVRPNLADTAQKMRADVEGEICALRAGLRRVVRSFQPSSTRDSFDGVDLSEDQLANTIASLRVGQYPDRAFTTTSIAVDPTAAAVYILDMSDSMKGWVQEANKIMLAGASAMEDIRFASACIGFRDKGSNPLPVTPGRAAEMAACHRNHAVEIVVFKFFHERLGRVLTRFPQARAGGSTPMADGLQAGIEAARTRAERLRMVFLISDGDPNPGTEDVIRHQIRSGQEAGLYFCGIAIGEGTEKILELIPNSIHVDRISKVPRILVQKVADLIKGQVRQATA